MAVTGQTALYAFLGACDDCGVNTAELRAAMRTWLEDHDMPRAIDPAEGPCALCRDAIGCKLRGCCGAANGTVAIPADGKICNCWQYRRGELTAGWACPQHGQQW